MHRFVSIIIVHSVRVTARVPLGLDGWLTGYAPKRCNAHLAPRLAGCVQGAHANKGLGHKFLKHVERCKALILIVDAAQRAPDEGLHTLLRELDLYQEGLSARAAVVVANKMDLPEAHDGLARLRACTALPVVQCAAKDGNGIDDVSKALARFAQPY